MINQTVKIYVSTYNDYNKGGWITLTDFDNLEDFYNACKELHKDKSDPEFMFQDIDSEGFSYTEVLYKYIGKSSINEDIFDVIGILEEIEDEGTLLSYWGKYDLDRHIYDFSDPEKFFNEFFADSPYDAVRAAHFGEIHWGDDYIYFNGCGNLETTNDITSVIDVSELVDFVIDNPGIRY